jgi:hypothetical protein
VEQKLLIRQEVLVIVLIVQNAGLKWYGNKYIATRLAIKKIVKGYTLAYFKHQGIALVKLRLIY